ncbi:hypothetical protein IscW_ISCW002577 [Ixodes scapularis]|uniref:Protein SAAL1 n=1 Tax=Ixodes scapularis TaxID=6945 RepID=B7P7Q7_IXOSC|nr:hypothetical protein IscW_ISCW002577 [Ixodes scapularis]|eukprot:XP_002399457.1 hypothetical protein IscW_ISCW002577 [Ixodes scapularis]
MCNIVSYTDVNTWLQRIALVQAAENESANGEADMEEVVELDREVEQELCTLWDMAANSDVARFLHEFKAFEIFLQIIKTSRSPRLVEILVGILGNMAVFPDLSLALSQEDSMLQMVLQLLGGSDAPTLLQLLSAMEKQEFLDAFWHLLHVLDYETDIRDMLVPWRDKLETLLFDWLQGQGQESPTLPPRSCWRTLGTGLTLVTDLRDASCASASQPLATTFRDTRTAFYTRYNFQRSFCSTSHHLKVLYGALPSFYTP